jgi:L-amino acid N-acyltransferase YncA
MSNNTLQIRAMLMDDWHAVAEIYLQGIKTGHATFQQDVPSWEDWDRGHLKICRLIAGINGQVAGWAALSPVSGRCVYAGVAEVSIYVSDSFRGQKIGTKLMKKLVDESEVNGIWTLQAGIFRENLASISLHESHGFRLMGYREKIGRMNGRWRDTLLFERRSSITGVD